MKEIQVHVWVYPLSTYKLFLDKKKAYHPYVFHNFCNSIEDNIIADFLNGLDYNVSYHKKKPTRIGLPPKEREKNSKKVYRH